MKKIILALTAVGIITNAMAQEPKSILTYGDINLNNNTNSGLQRTIVWDATFGLGFQFNQNWTLGANVSWGQNAFRDSNSVNSNPLKNTENNYLIGPFARYSQYLNRSEIFFWFTQVNLNYEGGYHTNSDGVPAYNKHTGIYAGIYPALGINFYRGFCANFSIGGINYQTDKNQNGTYSSNTFNITFGQMINFGISKNFNTGHKMHINHIPGDETIRRTIISAGDDDDELPKKHKRVRGSDEDE